MLYKYKPKTKGFKGEIEIEIPNYIERLKIIREAQFSFNQKDGSVEASISSSNLDALIKLLELTKKYIKKVDVTFGRAKFESYEMLLEDPRYSEICNEVANAIVNGVSVGES